MLSFVEEEETLTDFINLSLKLLFFLTGKYSECIPCLWEVIAASEEQFGPDSVEVGHELRKLSDVMMHDIRASNPKERK